MSSSFYVLIRKLAFQLRILVSWGRPFVLFKLFEDDHLSCTHSRRDNSNKLNLEGILRIDSVSGANELRFLC